MGCEAWNDDNSGVSGTEKVTVSVEQANAANDRMGTVRDNAKGDQDAFTELRKAVAPTYEGESAQSWYDATITVSGYLGTIWLSLSTTITEMQKICQDFVDTDDAASERTESMTDCENGGN